MFTTSQPLTKAADPLTVNVVITSAKIDGVEQTDDYRLKLAKNSVTVITFELQDATGNVMPVGTEVEPESFAVPLGQLGGAVVDSL